MSQKIGVYAGTFDPLHEGHLAFAETALESAGLDQVVFLPEPFPRRKINVTPIKQRVENIEASLEGQDSLSVVHIDQLQFTVDQTMPVLNRLFPQAEFSFLIGSDLVSHLHYWHNFEIIRQNYSLIVGMRDGDEESSVLNYLKALNVRFEIVKTRYSGVSSSQKKLPARK